MKLTTILLDLDGTLLPMDNDAFTKGYFKLLAAKLSPHGYEPKQLVDAIWTGTAAMVKNDGARSNEEVFWKIFADIYGEKMFGTSNDDKVEEISIGEKENVEAEETEMTYVCRNLISVVERQKEIIDELLKMKQEIGALKCHAVDMTPVNKKQK